MMLNKQKFKSQTDEVLRLLQHKKSIACVDFAVKYGILRYGHCIRKLRTGQNRNKRRYKIEMIDKYVKMGNRKSRHTSYSLK